MDREDEKGEGMVFADVKEIQSALDAKAVSSARPRQGALSHHRRRRHRAIVVRVETTPGRMLLSEILPRNINVPFSLINRLLTKKDIQNVIDASSTAIAVRKRR